MILKIIEKIFLKFLVKFKKKNTTKMQVDSKKEEKINRIATPMDFGVYTGWKPSVETLREYEIRKGINPNAIPSETNIERVRDNKKGSELKDTMIEAVVSGVVEVLVEEVVGDQCETIKDKVEEIFEDIKDEIEDNLDL